jgi:hypothetical protein
MKSRIAVLAAMLLLAVPGAAMATTVNYWGFNYLSPTNPPGWTCSSIQYAGYACVSYTNGWTTSEVQNNSGGQITVGFLDTYGTYTAVDRSGIATYDVYTSSGHWGTPPFRPGCGHGGGTNYVQCRAIN